ncbi:MAG: hypothetical protein Q8P22_02525, partial [Chloroflexota bacterium]|nr:hypothetical protein [Chloroflexota bacterium]
PGPGPLSAHFGGGGGALLAPGRLLLPLTWTRCGPGWSPRAGLGPPWATLSALSNGFSTASSWEWLRHQFVQGHSVEHVEALLAA